MEYKQARKIKQSGLLNNISQRIMSGESVGASVKTSIGERTQAAATLLKEKFDPMNIAKVVTGGSNIGPALVGTMMGRSAEDMENFTNIKSRKKEKATVNPVSNVPSTASQIKPAKGDEVNYQEKSYRWMGGQWGEVNPKTNRTGKLAKKDVSPLLFQIWSDGGFINVPEPPKEQPKKEKQTRVRGSGKSAEITDSLMKIYNLLQKTSADKTKAIDLEKDLEEERKTEDERRHKELINALLKMGGVGGSTNIVKEKKETNSILSSLLGLFGGFLGEGGGLKPPPPEDKSGKGGKGEKESGKGGKESEKGGKGGSSAEPNQKGGGSGSSEGGKLGGVKPGDVKGSGSASRIGEGKPLSPFGSVGEGREMAKNMPKKNTAERIKDVKDKLLKELTKETGYKKALDKSPEAIKTIMRSPIYKGIVNGMDFLGRIPGVQHLTTTIDLMNDLQSLKSLADEGELSEEQLKKGTRKAWTLALSRAGGTELGIGIGTLIGIPISAVAGMSGIGVAAIPFIQGGLAIAGGMGGYLAGDQFGEMLYEHFLTGEPLLKASKGMQELNRGLIENKPKTEGFSLGTGELASLSMDQVGALNPINDLTSENLDLNLNAGGGESSPVVINSSTTNTNSGSAKSTTVSPGGNIRTDNKSINRALQASTAIV